MKGTIYYVAIIAMAIFSHVKISSFRAKAHLVFHWCFYNKNVYHARFRNEFSFFFLSTPEQRTIFTVKKRRDTIYV